MTARIGTDSVLAPSELRSVRLPPAVLQTCKKAFCNTLGRVPRHWVHPVQNNDGEGHRRVEDEGGRRDRERSSNHVRQIRVER